MYNIKKTIFIFTTCCLLIYSQLGHALIEKYAQPSETSRISLLSLPWSGWTDEQIDTAIEELTLQLSRNEIEELSLNALALGAQRLQQLLSIIAGTGASLTRLNITDLTDETILILAEFVRNNPRVTLLGAYPATDNDYGPNFRVLIDAIAENNLLRQIDFNTRVLGDPEFALIADMLARSLSIRYCNLDGAHVTIFDGNRATIEGYQRIGNAIRLNRGNLETVEIGHNLSPEQGLALLRGILLNPRPISIGLDYNPFSRIDDTDMRGNIFYRIFERNRMIQNSMEMIRARIMPQIGIERFIQNGRNFEINHLRPVPNNLFATLPPNVMQNIFAFYWDERTIYNALIPFLRSPRLVTEEAFFRNQLNEDEMGILIRLRKLQLQIDEYQRGIETEFGPVLHPDDQPLGGPVLHPQLGEHVLPPPGAWNWIPDLWSWCSLL